MESIDDDGWVLLLFVGMLDLAAKLEHSRMLRRQLSNSGEGDNAGTSFSGGIRRKRASGRAVAALDGGALPRGRAGGARVLSLLPAAPAWSCAHPWIIVRGWVLGQGRGAGFGRSNVENTQPVSFVRRNAVGKLPIVEVGRLMCPRRLYR